MKQFLLLFIANLAFVLVTAQTISPSNNNEYCPEIEYTFFAAVGRPLSCRRLVFDQRLIEIFPSSRFLAHETRKMKSMIENTAQRN